MLFCNQKMNFFLWQSNHVVSSPRLSTSHSTEIHGPSSMSLLWGLRKGRISTSDTWEEGNRGHQPDSGRGHDMSRWRLAVHWVAQVLPMLPTPCFKPQQGVSTMATCCNYVWSSKATVALAAPKLSQNLWEAGHRRQYVSISMYQRPLGDSCAGEVVSHQATPYSYHQSLNENQLPCSFLYQKFAIKRRKLPNVCGVWFFLSLLMWGEILFQSNATGSAPLPVLWELYGGWNEVLHSWQASWGPESRREWAAVSGHLRLLGPFSPME